MLIRRVRNQRGQSIIEYLIIAAAIVGAILIFGPLLGTTVQGIGTASNTRMQSVTPVVTANITAKAN